MSLEETTQDTILLLLYVDVREIVKLFFKLRWNHSYHYITYSHIKANILKYIVYLERD